jgi:CRP-like cAMP-binding protein
VQPFELSPITTKLGEIDWLSGVPDEELALIDRHTTLGAVPASRMLCGQGEPGLEAFIVLTGEAAVIADGHTIARLVSGDFCGEMALVRETVRSAHVVALTPMHLLAMSKADFDLLRRESPTFSQQVKATMAIRLPDAHPAEP